MSLTPLGVYAAQGAGGAPPATPPTVGGYTSGSSNSAAVSLTTPTCAVGDLLVAMWSIRSTSRNPLLPSGWTWLLSSVYTGSNMRDAALYKVADSGDAAGGSHSFALDSYGIAHSVSFVTVQGSGSIDSAARTGYSTGSTSRAAGPLTPGQANNLLLHMATWRDTSTYTAPSTPGTWTKQGQETALVTGTAIASSPYDSTSSTGTVTGSVSATTTGAAWLVVCAPA